MNCPHCDRDLEGDELVTRLCTSDDCPRFDLLEALEIIAAGNTDPDRMVEIARAALAKAGA